VFKEQDEGKHELERGPETSARSSTRPCVRLPSNSYLLLGSSPPSQASEPVDAPLQDAKTHHDRNKTTEQAWSFG
jgi:hypothetical protein